MLLQGLTDGAIVLPNILLAEIAENGDVTVTYGDCEEEILTGGEALGLWQRLERLEAAENFNWFASFQNYFINVSKVSRYRDSGDGLLTVIFSDGQAIEFEGVDVESLLDLIEEYITKSDALFNRLKIEAAKK